MPQARRYPKGVARREEIISATQKVIEREGYRGATLRAVARHLDVKHAHILYYFPSRSHLMREVIRKWDDEIGAMIASDGGVLEWFAETLRWNIDLKPVVHLYLAYAAEALDGEEPGNEYFRARFASVTTTLAQAIRRGQDRGDIRPGVEPLHSARMLVAAADGLQLQWLMGVDVDPADDIDTAIAELYVNPSVFHAARARVRAGSVSPAARASEA